MAKFTLEDTIKTFSYHQALVVYWFCEGLSNEDIAERFHYRKSWVVWQMSFVYYKLGLDRPDTNGRKLHWNTRRDILREKVCPILRKLINDDPELLDRFPLIPPNVLAESIVDLRPEIPIPPLDHPIPLPEPPAEPPPLPPDGQIPPPEPPPDFYPIELYNAWLAVLEDDAKDNPPPGPQPIIIPAGTGRRRSRGELIGFLLAILLGCAAVGVLAFWLGRGGSFAPATQTSAPTIQPTLTMTIEPSPTIQITETPLLVECSISNLT